MLSSIAPPNFFKDSDNVLPAVRSSSIVFVNLFSAAFAVRLSIDDMASVSVNPHDAILYNFLKNFNSTSSVIDVEPLKPLLLLSLNKVFEIDLYSSIDIIRTPFLVRSAIADFLSSASIVDDVILPDAIPL